MGGFEPELSGLEATTLLTVATATPRKKHLLVH